MNTSGFLEQIMGEKDKSVVEAIQDHLILLLNTRQGSVSHLPDYGLPDLSIVYSSFPKSVEFLQRSIKDTIEKYEPRLQNVRVQIQREEYTVFEVAFKISAEVNTEGKIAEIQFSTTISNTGRTNVEL
ncbi:MAG: type VI secretion system baseplate subunit TssE [Candidatus Desantisbacteria bacterium]